MPAWYVPTARFSSDGGERDDREVAGELLAATPRARAVRDAARPRRATPLPTPLADERDAAEQRTATERGTRGGSTVSTRGG